MSWQAVLTTTLLVFACLCALVPACTRTKRNRRTGLPAPRPDERSSLEQFKRIHQP
jgi:hypothetical protein